MHTKRMLLPALLPLLLVGLASATAASDPLELVMLPSSDGIPLGKPPHAVEWGVFTPFATLGAQGRAIQKGPSGEQVHQQRTRVMRWLHSLLTPVRLADAWLYLGTPSVRAAKTKMHNALVGDWLDAGFQVRLVELTELKLQQLQKIVDEAVGGLNRLVSGAVDDAQEKARDRQPKLQFLLCLNEEQLEKLSAVIKEKTLKPYALLAQRLLLVLTGRVHSVDSFLAKQANGTVDQLTARSFYQLQVADDGSTNPLWAELKRLEKKPKKCFEFADSALHPPPAGDDDFVKVEKEDFAQLENWTQLNPRNIRATGAKLVALASELARGHLKQASAVDLRTLVWTTLASYMQILCLSLAPHEFDLVESQLRFTVNITDVAVRLDGADITVDVFDLYLELLVGQCPTLADRLRQVHREAIQGWDLTGDFDLDRNLIFSRVSRSRLPAARPANRHADAYEQRGDVSGFELTYEQFREMHTKLAMLDGRSVQSIGLHRLSLRELRAWLVYAVLRAIWLTRCRAVVRDPDALDDDAWMLVDGDRSGAALLGLPDRDQYVSLFKDSFKLDLAFAELVATDGWLQPSAVASAVSEVLRNEGKLYAELADSSRWKLVEETASGYLQTITFRAQPADPVRSPGTRQTLKPELLLPQLSKRCLRWLCSVASEPARITLGGELFATEQPTDIKQVLPVLLYERLPPSLEAEIARTNALVRQRGAPLTEIEAAEKVKLFKAVIPDLSPPRTYRPVVIAH